MIGRLLGILAALTVGYVIAHLPSIWKAITYLIAFLAFSLLVAVIYRLFTRGGSDEQRPN